MAHKLHCLCLEFEYSTWVEECAFYSHYALFYKSHLPTITSFSLNFKISKYFSLSTEERCSSSLIILAALFNTFCSCLSYSYEMGEWPKLQSIIGVRTKQAVPHELQRNKMVLLTPEKVKTGNHVGTFSWWWLISEEWFLFKISGHQVFFSLVLSTIRTTSSYIKMGNILSQFLHLFVF